MIKKSITLLELVEEINFKYGEWLQMGYSLDSLLISLLHQERVKTFELEKKVDYLEKKVHP
jgi:hypothetical protein